MYLVLLVVHVIVTLSLIVIILIQRSEADGLGGLGGGGGGGAGFMTSRAQANLLTRTTAILATIFILNSLALSWLTQQDIRDRSYADKLVEQEAAPVAVPVPDESNLTTPAAEEAAKKVLEAVEAVKKEVPVPDADAASGASDKKVPEVPQPE